MAKKQTELPGIERPAIKELDEALEAYAEKSQKSWELRRELDQLKARIVDLGKQHKLTSYRNSTAMPPLVLTLKASELKVKVKVKAEGGTVDEAEVAE